MSYQKVTGTLSQGAHPGSYNGQDALNDMLVVEKNDICCFTQLHDDRGGYDNAPALCCTDHKDPPVMVNDERKGMFMDENRKYVVRRLTPLECCRLQGFPDWWEDGCNGSDSNRYKMWGNGVGLPCTAFVLSAVKKLEEIDGGICNEAD